MVRGWEVEVAGWAAKVQDGAAGSREGVQGGREGRAELLWVVPRVVLRDDLLQAKGQGTGAGSGASHLPEPSRRGEGWTELWGQNPGPWLPRGFGPAHTASMPPSAWGGGIGPSLKVGPQVDRVPLTGVCKMWITAGLVHLRLRQLDEGADRPPEFETLGPLAWLALTNPQIPGSPHQDSVYPPDGAWTLPPPPRGRVPPQVQRQ